MDRAPYHLPFGRNQIPGWKCPACGTGHLALDPKHLIARETAQSLVEKKHPEWEPDWIRYVFACTFHCNNPNCKEPIACSGTGSVEYVEVEDEQYGWGHVPEDRFTPKFFMPALTLMDIPGDCRASVSVHLEESFALFFNDPGAALNAARAAVEALLTDLGVKRFVVSKGKRRPINLHQRILHLPAKYQHLADLMLAAKWLGNAGSHDSGAPTQADVRVMYDLLEHVLSEIYEEKGKKLKAIAKKVNKKKGPAS
ncbi:DUF4145 domain-containing protein [Massilia sp. YIM B02763]|uniref:DUF4145 domain-containing protein n=1 Tax=Massilia sp. YIM B02763 TaxID=3050130 RepID=UPI0025B694FA|nr:DUF4145 domain-containing protein [Massilia sp. YIM B02763]MDN4053163.1 DUF4145 domain-containing protein [Massilia sp. YIM B02763]